MNDKHPYMDYLQYRAACRLVHECCNYDNGNCILLDNGEPCVCVQSISYSLLCRWFIAAVLPLDGKLEAALLHRADRKRCTECGGYFLPYYGFILPVQLRLQSTRHSDLQSRNHCYL